MLVNCLVNLKIGESLVDFDESPGEVTLDGETDGLKAGLFRIAAEELVHALGVTVEGGLSLHTKKRRSKGFRTG
jgi:hypothetical protein